MIRLSYDHFLSPYRIILNQHVWICTCCVWGGPQHKLFDDHFGPKSGISRLFSTTNSCWNRGAFNNLLLWKPGGFQQPFFADSCVTGHTTAFPQTVQTIPLTHVSPNHCSKFQNMTPDHILFVRTQQWEIAVKHNLHEGLKAGDIHTRKTQVKTKIHG